MAMLVGWKSRYFPSMPSGVTVKTCAATGNVDRAKSRVDKNAGREMGGGMWDKGRLLHVKPLIGPPASYVKHGAILLAWQGARVVARHLRSEMTNKSHNGDRDGRPPGNFYPLPALRNARLNTLVPRRALLVCELPYAGASR